LLLALRLPNPPPEGQEVSVAGIILICLFSELIGDPTSEDSKFKQQQLPAWKPILTPRTTLPYFYVIGFAFIILGAVIYSASSSVRETKFVLRSLQEGLRGWELVMLA
jgi:hypothetical protein